MTALKSWRANLWGKPGRFKSDQNYLVVVPEDAKEGDGYRTKQGSGVAYGVLGKRLFTRKSAQDGRMYGFHVTKSGSLRFLKPKAELPSRVVPRPPPVAFDETTEIGPELLPEWKPRA